jgi:LacI family transcriptional regulator
MSVTIHEIAAQVGLSAKSVSRILRDENAPHRAETRERVRAVARELGYRANGSARAMRSRRAGSVALLLSTLGYRSVLPDPLREGIQAALAQSRLHLLVAALPDAQLTDEAYLPQVVREWAADGLLINYNADVPPGLPALIARHNIPSVWINAKRNGDCVHPDDFGAAWEATTRLIALGHRRIGFVEFGGVTHYSANDRIEGCRAALAQARLAPPAIFDGGGPPQTRAERARAWLRRPAGERPTAVFVYGAGLAPPILYAAATCGLRVPDDLSVVTFEAEPDASVGRRIDTWVLPEEAMGRAAVGVLLDKVKEPARALPPIALPAVHIPGDTLGPPE